MTTAIVHPVKGELITIQGRLCRVVEHVRNDGRDETGAFVRWPSVSFTAETVEEQAQ